MSNRVRELAEREAALLLRCAAQRRALGVEVLGIEARLQSVDRVAAVARSTLLNPVVIVGGLVTLLALGRTRSFKFIGRGLVLFSTGRRLVRIAQGLNVAGALLPLLKRRAARSGSAPSTP